MALLIFSAFSAPAWPTSSLLADVENEAHDVSGWPTNALFPHARHCFCSKMENGEKNWLTENSTQICIDFLCQQRRAFWCFSCHWLTFNNISYNVLIGHWFHTTILTSLELPAHHCIHVYHEIQITKTGVKNSVPFWVETNGTISALTIKQQQVQYHCSKAWDQNFTDGIACNI